MPVNGRTPVVDEAQSHLKMLGNLHVTRQAHHLIVEIVEVERREVDCVAVFFLNYFQYARVGYPVAVGPCQFHPSVAFRIEGIAEWGVEVKLLNLEIVSQPWREGYVSVRRKYVSGTDVHLVCKSVAVAIAQV